MAPVATARSESGKLSDFLSGGSLVRFGAIALLIGFILYATLHTIPVVSRDVDLLHAVYAVDAQGITLEGELLKRLEEGRRRFLRILLSGEDQQERTKQAHRLEITDQQVKQSGEAVARLGVVPAETQQRFFDRWHQYLQLRDRMLAMSSQGKPLADVRRVDFDFGQESFQAVEESVNGTRLAFEQSSATHVRAVTDALTFAIRELLLLLAATILCLGLLIWMDWRRSRIEKKLHHTTSELLASEARFQQAYMGVAVGMGMFKLDGTVVSLNARAAEMLGCDADEVIGTKVSQFMAPEFRELQVNQLAALPASGANSYQTERRIIRKDGKAAWVRNSVTLLNSAGSEPFYFSISEEITRQKEAIERLVYLANYDPVTNLPNLRSFEERLATLLSEPRAAHSDGVALIYMEIDSFDFVKETFGRAVADRVLVEISLGVADFRARSLMVARLDDHTFGVLVQAAHYDEAALALASELKDVFHRAGDAGKHHIPLSASIGIAYSHHPDGPAHGGDLDAARLIKYARAAMLEARSRGGDSIHIADPALQNRAVQRHQIELALLTGIREEEFSVMFQPQFEVASGRLMRFEALCRWTSAELGHIPPDRFIPIAEQTGLMVEIGRRVLLAALREAGRWTDSGRSIGVAVNISPMQFMRPDFTASITEALAITNFPPALLELEITEGIFIRDLNLAISRIRELQRLGLSIALDDFGTGYSSLSYLQRMPIDAVKLDRSFVSELTTDPATVSMVRSVLAMASALKLRVVTEGVETEEQLDILRTLGCDEAQGYLLGRPESADMALKRVLEAPVESAHSQM